MDYYRLASKIVQGYFQKLSSAQIKSLSFYTMSEVLDAMEEDLEELNGEMQKMRQAQAKLRHYMESIKKRMAELQSSKRETERELSASEEWMNLLVRSRSPALRSAAEQSQVQRVVRFCCYIPKLLLLFLERALLPDTG
jgi:septal ring factor EnvC (AmiA/AmiB activator)